MEPRRSYANCTWAERQLPAGAPLWLGPWRQRWCCLALSARASRLVEVQPDRCAQCPLWQPRAELSRHGR